MVRERERERNVYKRIVTCEFKLTLRLDAAA